MTYYPPMYLLLRLGLRARLELEWCWNWYWGSRACNARKEYASALL